jgi:hypothetical protein
VDFAKYAAMMVFRATEAARSERKRAKGRAAIWKQVFLFPVTGGFSLIRYLLRRARE